MPAKSASSLSELENPRSGGFLVTDRMLEMFKSKPKAKDEQDGGKGGA